MRRLLLLPVLALVTMMFVATPASAATVTSFTVSTSAIEPTSGPITVEPGTTITLDWLTSAGIDETFAIIASSTGPAPSPDFDGNRTSTGQLELVDGAFINQDSQTLTLATRGTYTFTITIEGEPTDTSTITVVVAETIDVPAVTFPEPCLAFLPEDPNVSYGVNYGQSGNALEAGTVDLTELLENGIPLEIVAVPNEGFVFPEGADNRFEVPDLEDCFGEFVESGIVDVDAICQAVTFTNLLDETVLVAYTDADFSELGDEFELAAGASRTVDTDLDLLVSFAAPESGEVLQVNEIEVEQDCTPAGAGADFPTVAPAAGSDGASTAGLGALIALTLAGGAALGARRLPRG